MPLHRHQSGQDVAKVQAQPRFLTMMANNRFPRYGSSQAAVVAQAIVRPRTAPSPPALEAPDLAIARLVGNVLVRYGAILGFIVVWELVARLSLVDASVIPPFTQVVA